MDSARALSAFRARGRNRICYGRAGQPRSYRINNCRAHLADEYRYNRKRPIDRNRRALRVAFRSRDYFLVKLFVARKISVAHLVASIDFTRTGPASERPASPRIFLRDSFRCPLANEEMASAYPSRALCRGRNYARHFRSLGDSIPPEHDYANRTA